MNYLYELFHQKLNANLTVLSACETGLGEIKRGEGIVGIGKGFSYAGAKSMVTSLWQVNDVQTGALMTDFFRPSSPRTFSINSRTSRPLSPIRAITLTSDFVERAIIPIRTDFPTPDPAMIPTR